jgi:general secretion pathway protein B
MSFILDALKKSEAERQRQAGPTLLEVRVTPPRRRLPLWAVALAVLLGINLVALLWFMLRKPEAAPVPVAAAPSTAPAAAVPPPVIVTAPAQPAAVTPAPATAAPAAAAAPSAAESAANPADLQPAVPASAGATRDTRDTRDTQGLPSYADVGSNMPDLRLDLHVYSPRAAERYALINMHKVHEGDVLPEGARVIAINKDGVVLSYHDQEFILGQQE